MEYRLRDMSWSEFAERSKTAKTIIIPSGACEVYGRHLPLGSDIIVADRVAALIAKEVNGIVAPCVEVGQSKTLTGFPGTIAISGAALAGVYREMILEFIRLGFKAFLLNTHLNNTQPLNEVLEDLRHSHGIKYGQIGWWQYIPSISSDVFTHPVAHGHASEAGTSVMLHLAPELVHMEDAAATTNRYADKWPTITKSVGYEEKSDSGTLGDGTIGTAEKGKIVVERGVEQISDFIKNFLEKE